MKSVPPESDAPPSPPPPSSVADGGSEASGEAPMQAHGSPVGLPQPGRPEREQKAPLEASGDPCHRAAPRVLHPGLRPGRACSSSTSTRRTSGSSTSGSGTASVRAASSRRGCSCAPSSRPRRRRRETLVARLGRPVRCRVRDRADVGPFLVDRGAAGRVDRPRSRRHAARRSRESSRKRRRRRRTSGATALAASLACRSAVTIRYHLAPEEIRRLLSDWAKTADRFTCPHGRPVVLSMTEEELEKYFKRR